MPAGSPDAPPPGPVAPAGSPDGLPPGPRASEDAYRLRAFPGWDRVAVGTHCVDCYPACCPVRVYVKDGQVVREELSGNLEPVEAGVPDMNPMGCQKGLAWSAQHRAADRPLHPLRRVGERGSGRWERISWDEAFDTIADAVIDAIDDVGPEALVYEGSPQIGAVVPAVRFMTTLGGTALDVNGSINDFWCGFHQTFGKFFVTSSVDDAFHADCIVVWHGNPAYTSQPAYHYFPEARYRGARVVLISPDVNPSHGQADYHVPVRQGTDAALALAMCQVVLAEGLVDHAFVRRQTDLSLLVRCDTGMFLRESDVVGGGRPDRFFHVSGGGALVPADPANLLAGAEPALDGTVEVDLAGGGRAACEPLLARVRRQLDAEYTPEAVADVCGTHPSTVRAVARLVASGRTKVFSGAGAAKYFHGDLMGRSMLLLLGLTGNWGRKGSGVTAWATGLFDGQTIAMTKTKPGVEGATEVLDALAMVVETAKQVDPTLSDELALIEMWRQFSAEGPLVPPALFWYVHAGHRERWNRREWGEPTMERSFDEYWDEALATGAWDGFARRVSPERPPRVLFEIAGNMLRRTRGGMGVLLEHLWPKLDLIVSVDVRMSQTARYADIVLPATQAYEKTVFSLPSPWTMFLAMTDRAVPPPGEARSEWELLADLLAHLAERARARGRESYVDSGGTRRRYEDLRDAFTLGGRLVDDESVAAEMVHDAVVAGTMPEGTTVETFRERGWSRYSGWGAMSMAQGQASPFPDHETHSPLRHHVERGDPYPTLTRRAQFLIEHPWYREAGEDLPVHKEPPPMGGDYPLRLSGGHGRWSVHAMNMTNELILGTHRGRPFVLMHPADAAARGVGDDALVRVFNDCGEFRVWTRLSPAQRPGSLTVYNGYEGFLFPGGKGPNEVEPGLVKWLHLAQGYGHLRYAPTEWQPTPFDRCISVDVEGAGGAATGTAGP